MGRRLFSGGNPLPGTWHRRVPDHRAVPYFQAGCILRPSFLIPIIIFLPFRSAAEKSVSLPLSRYPGIPTAAGRHGVGLRWRTASGRVFLRPGRTDTFPALCASQGVAGVENGKANRFRARSEDKMEQTVGLQLDPRLTRRANLAYRAMVHVRSREIVTGRKP